jgi:uncharacterized protein
MSNAPTAARLRLRRWAAAAALLGALLLACVAVAEVAVPTLTAHVTDHTHTLTPAQVDQLDQRLRALEARKGSQLVILMVPTTGEETIEGYSLKVAEHNRIGRDKVDDGLLLLVAKDDRKARIEVGYGLEGVVTDAISSRVIREYLAPHFREGDYAGGIDAASAVLEKLVEGEPLPPPMAAQDSGGSEPPWIFAIVIGLFVGMFAAGTRMRPVVLRRLGAGGVAAAIAFFVIGGLSALAVAAIVAFLLSGARATSGGRYIGHPGGGGGGWGGGGFGGGGGGFSGGGGGFGGGGASGGW